MKYFPCGHNNGNWMYPEGWTAYCWCGVKSEFAFQFTNGGSMEEPKECKPNKLSHKITKALETGFACHICGYQSVTFDGSVPKECFHCGHAHPKKVWQNHITNKMTVETIPL